MYDVLIGGGGPAGAVLATRLSEAGLDVLLAGVPRRFSSLEGMVERGRLALASAGCERALAALGPRVLRKASWRGTEYGGNHEYLVERSGFDAALWDDARERGVDARRCRVGRVERRGGRWFAELDGEPASARYWVDARGRQAPRARQVSRAPRVLGLSGWWQGRAGEPAAGISPFPEGWCWYARLPDGRTSLQLFVDGERQRPPSRAGLRAHYRRLVRSCAAACEVVGDSSMLGEPFVRAASLSLSCPVIDDAHARAGDAALALDPLAGHGMFEAMGLALTLAACIRTELERPADAALAQAFYRTRVEDEYWRLARTAREFYALETRWPGSSFWPTRARWPDAEPSHPSVQPGVGGIEIRAVSVDGFIEPRRVVVCPDAPRGVWQVGGVPLVDLLRRIGPQGPTSRHDIERMAATANWSLSATRAALAWLGERRLLHLRPETV